MATHGRKPWPWIAYPAAARWAPDAGLDWSATPVGPVEAGRRASRPPSASCSPPASRCSSGGATADQFLQRRLRADPRQAPPGRWAGRPREVWAEIWDDIGPLAEAVLRRGPRTWDEALLLIMERNGYPEETYYTFSYSPIPDDHGRRRRDVLRRAPRTPSGSSASDGWARSANWPPGTARRRPSRTPAATAAAGPRREPARLALRPALPVRRGRATARAGRRRPAWSAGLARPPRDGRSTSAERAAPWPFSRGPARAPAVRVSRTCRRVRAAARRGLGRSRRPARRRADRASGPDRPAGFLVAGLNPYGRFDDDYRGFLDLVAGQIAAAIANARAYEEERRRAEALAELDRAKTPSSPTSATSSAPR